MADKTQNITVKYVVDTTDLERASAILGRANSASNQLQQSGQKAGQGVSQGFNTARQSITSMEIQLARLKTQIEVSSNPKRITELSAQYKALKTQIDAAKTSAFGMAEANKKAGQSVQSMTQQFGGLITAAKIFVGFQIAKKAFEISLEFTKLAGNVEGVERAFTRAIPNSVKLLDDLQGATHGTINDLTLMQRTLQAKNLGIPVQELAGLFEFATIRAQQTGQSVDQLVDDIVNGLGRKSTRVIDNLGISASRIKDEFKGASLETLSVAEVTRGVGNIIREEMDKMGEYVDTSATKVAKLEVAWESLRTTVAKKIENSAFVEWLTEAANATERFIKGSRQLGQEQARSAAAAEVSSLMESKAYDNLGKDKQKQIDFIQQEINTRVELIGRTNDHIKAIVKERESLLKNGESPYSSRIETLNKLQRAESIRQFSLANAILILKKYRDELSKTNDDETKTTGIIERKKAQIEDLEKQLNSTNNITDLGRWGRLTTALEIARAELGDLQRAFSEGIDPKKMDMDLKTAEHSLTSFGTNIKRMEDQLAELANMTPTPSPQTVARLDTFWTNMGEMWKENWRDLTSDSIDFQADAINNLLDSEVDAMQAQLSQLKNHYQQQQQLAGDNERAKSELRVREDREVATLQKRMFEREKSLRKAQVIVDGAAAAIKAFVTAPNVYIAIAQAALIAATTIAQLRNIDKAQPRFAKGVINLQGPGTATSDSIPARLSKGESVMTAWETQHAGDVLKDIRAKKLDNKMLRDMKQGRPAITSVQRDDEKIIKAIKDNKPPDVIKQSNIVYEVRQHTESLRRKQRAKSMNI